MKKHFLQRFRLNGSNKLFSASKTICIIFLCFISLLCTCCKKDREKTEQEKREQFLDQMVINNPSCRFISLFGCNIGNVYDSFKDSLIEKGFENTNSTYDSHQWKGKFSDKEVGVQIYCCGKYIIQVCLSIGCKSEGDLQSTYRNALQSLNKKYGNYTREYDNNICWDRDIVRIDLYCTDFNNLVKSRNIVRIVYDNLPYQNWLKEYEGFKKRNDAINEKKAFDNNL